MMPARAVGLGRSGMEELADPLGIGGGAARRRHGLLSEQRQEGTAGRQSRRAHQHS